ncbi:hypothetical protein GALMADRAFT_142926 [Galerina marginata CBS 339.88]|uniref:RNA methyltransferase n=1 Tax=Galerina marginata (strain CBS 339.88) TaxID=685588 RepID=A0A067SY51_GALM3|nr:hypothetical protein GALMADRAFT_142926 [Galerina marginata CBS 339.88]
MTTVPIHGNYHGYYTKRPFVSDERLVALPPDLFRGAQVLDIGCNEGWVTCEIGTVCFSTFLHHSHDRLSQPEWYTAQSYGARCVVGVDIDDSLIQGAWRRRRAVWSMQAPTQPRTSSESDGNPSDNPAPKKKRKVQHPDGTQATEQMPTRLIQSHYFPASCEHEFGSLPIPPSSNRGKDVFPHNISFRTADWTQKEIPENSGGYDVVVGFSISKWIHLNQGDDGLKAFFRRVYDVLKPGGTFVLEPQSWDSYAKARRGNQKLKENAQKLDIRPADFEAILREIGFGPVRHFGTVGEGGFSRPVDLYTKP